MKKFSIKFVLFVLLTAVIIGGAAPALAQDDGRLNYMVTRAPLAVYMDDAGGFEVWSTDELNQFLPLNLEVSATPEEVIAALALAKETGKDVVIAGYVNHFALIAKADGTLKAEVFGSYGCDFMPDGEANYGWCLGYGSDEVEEIEEELEFQEVLA